MKRILLPLCSVLCFAVLGEGINYTRLRKRVTGRELINNAVQRINAPRSIRYSKLKLIVAAKAAGKWGDVKSFIEANDMLDEWNACQYITSDYPAFIAATNAVVASGIATSDQIAVFLKLAED